MFAPLGQRLLDYSLTLPPMASYAFSLSSPATPPWTPHDDAFRTHTLWPAVLQAALGAALLTITAGILAKIFNRSSSSSRPLNVLGSVGNCPKPVSCPKTGAVQMVDNRARMGALAIAISVAQTAVIAIWWSRSRETPELLASVLLQCAIVVLTMLVVFYAKMLTSNRFLYRGLFPWLAPALVAVQLAVCTCESYFSFFTPLHRDESVIGWAASVRSNCLAGSTIASALLLLALSMVQQRPYFIRPLHGDASGVTPAAAYADRCTIVSATDNSTPLAPPRTVDPAELVDTLEYSSSWFSRLSFSWPNDLLGKGVRRQLEYTDLYRLDDKDMPAHAWRRFQRHRRDGRSLITTLLITFAPELSLQCVLALAESVLQFSGPFFLQRILRSIDVLGSKSSEGEGTKTLRSAYLDAFGLLFFTLLTSVVSHQTLWIGRQIGIRLKGLLVGELSAKTLRRRGKGSWENSDDAEKDEDGDGDDDDEASSASAAADGKIMNLLTADFNRVTEVSAYMDNVYTMPIMMLIGIWYMYVLLGVSALVGLSVSILFVPLSKILFRYLAKIETKLNALSDERVTVITELLQGIKAVKLFGWESRFLERVDERREKQLTYMWKMMTAWIRTELVSTLAPMFVLISIFATYVAVYGNRLTAEIAFTSISVFKIIRMVFEHLPGLLNWMIGGYVSLKRIDEYLQQAQVQDLEERVDAADCNGGSELGFASADLEWTSSSPAEADATAAPTPPGAVDEQTPLLVVHPPGSQSSALLENVDMVPFSLKNISLRFPAGGLSLIAGPTGSGKSSLLSALIGEMTLTSGRILLPTARTPSTDPVLGDLTGSGLAISDIAYVAQEAWLRNATIRENILFGEPYSQQRYEEVLRVCSLKPDLRILTAGDMTEIGERGVTLSGGQKQRVALARAVYSSRRILLIDDCLSAVDTHTAKHILSECLVGKTPLMQGRTRVLVTHHVSLCLPFAQHVVMLREGEIMLQGAPGELQASGAFSDVIAELEKNNVSPDAEDDEQSPKSTSDNAAETDDRLKTEDSYNDERLRLLAEQKGLDTSIDAAAIQGMLVEDEEREQGYIKPEVWLTFLSACGGSWFWVGVVAFLVASQVIIVLQDYWVRVWVASTASGDNHHTTMFWLGMYMAICIAGALWIYVELVFINSGMIRACRSIHSRLIRTVVHATPRFFDSTPLGRIINRFSRDMQVLDENTIDTIVWWIMDILAVLSVFVIICSVTPAFVVVAILVSLVYFAIAYYYLSASRELKRLESNSMSPLLSLFGELILGVSSVRAFGAGQVYIKEALDRISVHNRSFYMVWSSNRWLSVRIDLAGASVSFASAILVLASLDSLDAGLAGFVLSYALTFSERMLWAIRNYGANELNMNAIERIMQYLKVDQEAVLHSLPGNEPPSNWPSSGETVIEDLVVEYVPGTPVLHGISLRARHGEKIGVVGRTGAGKSTLSLALMRFIEAKSGHVLLDGVDISQIGLEELRRNVTIIPQDPVLFNGTIRLNLDPFDEYPDELVWDALKRAYLVNERSSVSSSRLTSAVASTAVSIHDSSEIAGQPERMAGIFNSLDAEIKENGQNLSLGQRQLVALARALVRRSRLIVMDEATASVDFDTDSRIQRTIRGSEFANSTLFCVAHRLRTIIDYDRVLVLDKGKVVEFDTPSNLLQKSDGIFKGMCEQSGEYDQLVKLASAHT